MMNLMINGQSHRTEVPDDMPLLWVLRDVLGLTGTKFGCGIALCGACTVHVDGEPVRSCSLSVSDVGARLVTTIEAIHSTPNGRKVQQAWLDQEVVQVIGATPGGIRRIGVVFGGSFEGERLSGEVLDGGNDWQLVRQDGATTLDVRIALRTTDRAIIGMTYRGLRHGPSDVIGRLENGEVGDPGSYYFRVAPFFETAAPQYDWLNRVVAVGIGHRMADGPIYNVFQVQ